MRKESPEDLHLETRSVECLPVLKRVLAKGSVTAISTLFFVRSVINVRVDCMLGLFNAALLFSQISEK
jgi:hypothetical protein